MQYQDVMQQFSAELPDETSIEVPKTWGQGRATFGGMASALAAKHLTFGAVSEASIRSLTVSFVAPLTPGAAMLKRRILRQGKSVTQALMEIEQEGQVALVMLASFGEARESALNVTLDEALTVTPVKEALNKRIPSLPGAPEFTQHIEFILDAGHWPYSGGQQRVLAGRNRLKGQTAQTGLAEILALVDAWWPASLGLMTAPAPASSLTWTLEFLPGWSGFSGEEFWSYAASVEQGEDGYHIISARLWNPRGKLAAISRQVVAVFA